MIYRWRSFASDRKVSESRGILDGDLLESLLALDKSEMAKVLGSLDLKDNTNSLQNCNAADIIRWIEELVMLR